MTTKILALTDALGCLVRFELLPGNRFDTVGIAPLIKGIEFGGLIADKAFDSDAIIAELNERGAKAVISQHSRRTTPLKIDAEIYKWRHLIENFFGNTVFTANEKDRHVANRERAIRAWFGNVGRQTEQ